MAAAAVELKPKRLMLPQPELYLCSPTESLAVDDFLRTVFVPLCDDGTMLKRWSDLDECERRVVCTKFMVARKFEKDKAREMLTGYIALTKQRNLGDSPLFPTCLQIRGYDQEDVMKVLGQAIPRVPGDVDRTDVHINPFHHFTFHKWDKMGHPIHYELTGRTDPIKLLEKLKVLAKVGTNFTEPALELHLHCVEVGQQLARYNYLKRGGKEGRPVHSVVVIMDMKGLGYGTLTRAALDVFKAKTQADAQFFPEGMHHLFIVNCPTMITFAFNIVKGWVDPRVQTKLEFLKPHETGPRLREWIDAEHLPEELGGTCRCEGGCMHWPEEGAFVSPQADPLAEIVVIAAGKKNQRVVEGDVGEAACFEFDVEDRNVVFSAMYIADDGNEIEVASASKTDNGDDRFIFPAKGKLTLTWSNEHSWLRSKNVTLRVMKTTV